MTRIIRALRSESSDGVSQIVYYQAGIGSQGTNINKVVGGATAAGIAQNVREAYAFIAYNYANGDEIFLIGFSRGAFTARSVGGLIANVGVLTKAGMESFPIIYKVCCYSNPTHSSLALISIRTTPIEMKETTARLFPTSHFATSLSFGIRTMYESCNGEV